MLGSIILCGCLILCFVDAVALYKTMVAVFKIWLAIPKKKRMLLHSVIRWHESQLFLVVLYFLAV